MANWKEMTISEKIAALEDEAKRIVIAQTVLDDIRANAKSQDELKRIQVLQIVLDNYRGLNRDWTAKLKRIESRKQH